jgi:xanthine dehydrogenase iron-sulfur cluster and FAD-binding subunit A
VTTTEGIGNTKDGYHPVQQRLSGFHGTPCMCMSICGSCSHRLLAAGGRLLLKAAYLSLAA